MRGLFTILFVLLFGAGLPASLPAQNTAITALYGAQMACNPALAGCIAIPLTLTTLCTVACPAQTSPSFTDSLRFWGALNTVTVGACVSSTDGGLTWPACASQPFVAGNREFYAGASDGSVIAVGTPGGTCTIRRSTNLGVSWATVFTVVQACTSGNLEGQRLRCVTSGACEFIANNNTDSQVIRSSDNGQSWTAGEVGLLNAPNVGMAWDGSVGISASENPGVGGGFIVRAFSAIADVWAQSTNTWSTQGDCWGSFVYNATTPRVICQGAGAVPNALYSVRDTTGGLVASLTLPGANTTSIDIGGVGIAPFTNTFYIFAMPTVGGITVWLSRDNFVTFASLGTFGGGGAGIRGGNTFYSGGCVYLTAGTTPMFGKVCP
jgi:hypothetical protein